MTPVLSLLDTEDKFIASGSANRESRLLITKLGSKSSLLDEAGGGLDRSNVEEWEDSAASLDFI